jgi:hypothetical protein
MRRILFSAIATTALTFCATGTMARTPVPNASGSQVTNANTVRATAYQNRTMMHMPMSKRHATAKRHKVHASR